jgi:hypothetical protein
MKGPFRTENVMKGPFMTLRSQAPGYPASRD